MEHNSPDLLQGNRCYTPWTSFGRRNHGGREVSPWAPPFLSLQYCRMPNGVIKQCQYDANKMLPLEESLPHCCIQWYKVVHWTHSSKQPTQEIVDVFFHHQQPAKVPGWAWIRLSYQETCRKQINNWLTGWYPSKVLAAGLWYPTSNRRDLVVLSHNVYNI